MFRCLNLVKHIGVDQNTHQLLHLGVLYLLLLPRLFFLQALYVLLDTSGPVPEASHVEGTSVMTTPKLRSTLL